MRHSSQYQDTDEQGGGSQVVVLKDDENEGDEVKLVGLVTGLAGVRRAR